MWSSARPGRGDDDVGPALERADLLLHRRAAVERHDTSTPAALRVLVDGLGHLHRELARRHEHEAARAPAGSSGRLGDALQHRQRERGRLAGAGRGLAEQVAAVEQQRNRLALDGRRLLVAERRHRSDEHLVQSETAEAGDVFFASGHVLS